MIKRAITIYLLVLYLINVQAIKTNSLTQRSNSRLVPKSGFIYLYILLNLLKSQKMK